MGSRGPIARARFSIRFRAVRGPIVSLFAGAAVAGLYLVSFRQAPWWGGLIFLVVVSIGVFFWLSRRVLGRLEPLLAEAGKHLQQMRADQSAAEREQHQARGIATLRSAFRWSPWHPMIGAQLHAQLGSVLYVSDKLGEAEPHLRKSPRSVWTARAMLACLHFRRKDAEAMRKEFEGLCADKKACKESLLWTLYAFCERELSGKDAAVAVLERGHALMRSDEKLENNLERVKQGKDLKTQGYGGQWYQFKVGEPPKAQQMVQRAGGGGAMHPALRRSGGKRKR